MTRGLWRALCRPLSARDGSLRLRRLPQRYLQAASAASGLGAALLRLLLPERDPEHVARTLQDSLLRLDLHLVLWLDDLERFGSTQTAAAETPQADPSPATRFPAPIIALLHALAKQSRVGVVLATTERRLASAFIKLSQLERQVPRLGREAAAGLLQAFYEKVLLEKAYPFDHPAAGTAEVLLARRSNPDSQAAGRFLGAQWPPNLGKHSALGPNLIALAQQIAMRDLKYALRNAMGCWRIARGWVEPEELLAVAMIDAVAPGITEVIGRRQVPLLVQEYKQPDPSDSNETQPTPVTQPETSHPPAGKHMQRQTLALEVKKHLDSLKLDPGVCHLVKSIEEGLLGRHYATDWSVHGRRAQSLAQPEADALRDAYHHIDLRWHVLSLPRGWTYIFPPQERTDPAARPLPSDQDVLRALGQFVRDKDPERILACATQHPAGVLCFGCLLDREEKLALFRSWARGLRPCRAVGPLQPCIQALDTSPGRVPDASGTGPQPERRNANAPPVLQPPAPPPTRDANQLLALRQLWAPWFLHPGEESALASGARRLWQRAFCDAVRHRFDLVDLLLTFPIDGESAKRTHAQATKELAEMDPGLPTDQVKQALLDRTLLILSHTPLGVRST
ncbi:MAG: hypothetical protein ACPGUV_11745 [Polyangiales bacterium]